MRSALPFGQVITVKLEAPKKVLYGRIGKKILGEQGGEWLFSANYPNKVEFVKSLYKEFERIPAEIRIDSTRLSPEKVYKTVANQLKQQMILYSRLEG